MLTGYASRAGATAAAAAAPAATAAAREGAVAKARLRETTYWPR
jgi:hypothetical protein